MKQTSRLVDQKLMTWPILQLLGAGIDRQPQLNHNPAAGLYTVGFVLIGSFFWVNLLTTAIVDNYSQLINQLGANPVVSDHTQHPDAVLGCQARTTS